MIHGKMNKLSVYIIFTALLFVASIISAGILSANIVSAGGIDKIYVSNVSGDIESRMLVSIFATNMSDLGSLQLDLQYDKNVIIAENVTAGNAMSEGIFTSNIKDTGVTIGIISATGINGNGSIADITFNVVGSEGIFSPLTISIIPPTDSKNGPINVQSIGNATFTVGNIGTIGRISPTVGVSPTITRMMSNSDNGSRGDNGDLSRNGEASSGNVSNVGTLSGENSTHAETKTVTTTKESTVSTTIVPEETVVAEGTTKQQKMVQPDTIPKSPGLEAVASITILSLVYILERKKRQREQK